MMEKKYYQDTEGHTSSRTGMEAGNPGMIPEGNVSDETWKKEASREGYSRQRTEHVETGNKNAQRVKEIKAHDLEMEAGVSELT